MYGKIQASLSNVNNPVGKNQNKSVKNKKNDSKKASKSQVEPKLSPRVPGNVSVTPKIVPVIPKALMAGVFLANVPSVGSDYATSPDCVLSRSFSRVSDENFNGIVSFVKDNLLGLSDVQFPQELLNTTYLTQNSDGSPKTDSQRIYMLNQVFGEIVRKYVEANVFMDINVLRNGGGLYTATGLYCVPESENSGPLTCLSHFDTWTGSAAEKANLKYVEKKFQNAIKKLYQFLYPESTESNCDTMARLLGYSVDWTSPSTDELADFAQEADKLISTVNDTTTLVHKAGILIGQVDSASHTSTTVDGHALAQLCWDALNAYYTMVSVSRSRGSIVDYQDHQTEFENGLLTWSNIKKLAKKSDQDFVAAFLNNTYSSEYIQTQNLFNQHLFVKNYFDQATNNWDNVTIPQTYESLTYFSEQDFKPSIYRSAFSIAVELIEIAQPFPYLTNSTNILTSIQKEAIIRSQRILNPPSDYGVENYEADRDWLSSHPGIVEAVDQQIENLKAYKGKYLILDVTAQSLNLENANTSDFTKVAQKISAKNSNPEILRRFIDAKTEQLQVELVKDLTNQGQIDVLKTAMSEVVAENAAKIKTAQDLQSHLMVKYSGYQAKINFLNIRASAQDMTGQLGTMVSDLFNAQTERELLIIADNPLYSNVSTLILNTSVELHDIEQKAVTFYVAIDGHPNSQYFTGDIYPYYISSKNISSAINVEGSNLQDLNVFRSQVNVLDFITVSRLNIKTTNVFTFGSTQQVVHDTFLSDMIGEIKMIAYNVQQLNADVLQQKNFTNTSINELQNFVGDQKVTNDQVDLHLAALGAGLGAVNVTVQENQEDIDSKLRDVGSNFTKTDDQIKSLQKNVEDNKRNITAVGEGLDAVNGMVQENQEDNDRKFGEVVSNITKAGDHINSLRSDVEYNQRNISALVEGLDAVNVAVQENQQDNDRKFGEVVSNFTKTEDQIHSLHSKVAYNQQNQTAMNRQILSDITDLGEGLVAVNSSNLELNKALEDEKDKRVLDDKAIIFNALSSTGNTLDLTTGSKDRAALVENLEGKGLTSSGASNLVAGFSTANSGTEEQKAAFIDANDEATRTKLNQALKDVTDVNNKAIERADALQKALAKYPKVYQTNSAESLYLTAKADGDTEALNVVKGLNGAEENDLKTLIYNDKFASGMVLGEYVETSLTKMYTVANKAKELFGEVNAEVIASVLGAQTSALIQSGLRIAGGTHEVDDLNGFKEVEVDNVSSWYDQYKTNTSITLNGIYANAKKAIQQYPDLALTRSLDFNYLEQKANWDTDLIDMADLILNNQLSVKNLTNTILSNATSLIDNVVEDFKKRDAVVSSVNISFPFPDFSSEVITQYTDKNIANIVDAARRFMNNTPTLSDYNLLVSTKPAQITNAKTDYKNYEQQNELINLGKKVDVIQEIASQNQEMASQNTVDLQGLVTGKSSSLASTNTEGTATSTADYKTFTSNEKAVEQGQTLTVTTDAYESIIDYFTTPIALSLFGLGALAMLYVRQRNEDVKEAQDLKNAFSNALKDQLTEFKQKIQVISPNQMQIIETNLETINKNLNDLCVIEGRTHVNFYLPENIWRSILSNFERYKVEDNGLAYWGLAKQNLIPTEGYFEELDDKPNKKVPDKRDVYRQVSGSNIEHKDDGITDSSPNNSLVIPDSVTEVHESNTSDADLSGDVESGVPNSIYFRINQDTSWYRCDTNRAKALGEHFGKVLFSFVLENYDQLIQNPLLIGDDKVSVRSKMAIATKARFLALENPANYVSNFRRKNNPNCLGFLKAICGKNPSSQVNLSNDELSSIVAPTSKFERKELDHYAKAFVENYQSVLKQPSQNKGCGKKYQPGLIRNTFSEKKLASLRAILKIEARRSEKINYIKYKGSDGDSSEIVNHESLDLVVLERRLSNCELKLKKLKKGVNEVLYPNSIRNSKFYRLSQKSSSDSSQKSSSDSSQKSSSDSSQQDDSEKKST